MADQVRTEPAEVAEWSLNEVLAMQVVARPTAPFLLTSARDWTYAAVDQASDRFATALSAAGIGRGDPIAVATPNCAEWVVTWLAAAKLGCPIVALNVVYREREFEYMINQSGARALICVAQHKGFDFAAMLEGVTPRVADRA